MRAFTNSSISTRAHSTWASRAMYSTGPKDRSNVFGREAPSRNLRLPRTEVILATEFFAYFPNSTRNYSFLQRFVPAGADQKTIANMVNLHRKWEKWPAETNSVCKILRKEFQDNFDKKWSIRKHNDDNLTYPIVWNARDLTLKNVLLACEVHPKTNAVGQITNPPVENIPFADLAINVVRHPSYTSGDGFMLTRCVQYAELHPEKGYLFPRDFSKLVRKLQDGRTLQAKHYDNASIIRWKNKGAWAPGELRQVEAFPVIDEDSDDEDDQDPAASGVTDATASLPFLLAPQFGFGSFQVQSISAHPSSQGLTAHLSFQNPTAHPPFRRYKAHPPIRRYKFHPPYHGLVSQPSLSHGQAQGFVPPAAPNLQPSYHQGQYHPPSHNSFVQPNNQGNGPNPDN